MPFLMPDSSFLRVILWERSIEKSSRVGKKEGEKRHLNFTVEDGEAKGSSDFLPITQVLSVAY